MMGRTRLWVGLDVGATRMVACVIDDAGQVVIERDLATAAADLHAILKPIKRRVALIGLETGAYGTHLTRVLRLGYRIAVFDSRQASKFLAIRQNKTDKNDARGLAEVARLGRASVAEVRLKSQECQRLRSTLVTRQKLVRLRLATEGTIRSMFRLNGGNLKSSWSATTLRRHVQEELVRLRRTEKIDLRPEIEPLLSLCEAMRTYLEQLERQLRALAEEHPVCRRFLAIPGVGPICALSFYSAIEEPTRFRRNADIGAFLGMVPRVKQSGQSTVHFRISKIGNRMTRSHLVTAGMQHLRYGESAIQAWGKALGERIGKPRARMAVARRLAVAMLAMWKSDEPFEPNRGATIQSRSTSGDDIPMAA
jgi:transposase